MTKHNIPKDIKMIYNILNFIDKIRPIERVSAHCDIPCKIYDPITSQIAVLTMIRLVDLIEEIEKKDSITAQDYAQISRLVSQKEEHGHIVKDEIKQEHTEKESSLSDKPYSPVTSRQDNIITVDFNSIKNKLNGSA